MSIGSASIIPPGIKQDLPHPKTPWKFSNPIFERMGKLPWGQGQASKKCEVLPSDPECAFILKYFNHNKPANYGIAKIYCIHNPSLTNGFEAHLPKMNQRAETFKPEWEKEDCVAERREVIRRWKEQVKEYYPISVKKPSVEDPTREDIYLNVRVLPLWHGTTGAVCTSIASTGFTFFGKHHFFNSDAKAGAFKNVDPGYYGSGIYFTNSPKYAAMYNSGTLLMSWVSMYEPFPVINDVPHPAKGSDMGKLGIGASGYQTYNAHYIPVAPISKHPKCMEYYPCYQNQAPTCDELVVFQEAQALPRFWIELGVDFPKLLPKNPIIPGSFVIDSTSLPITVTAGLTIIATCSLDACVKKNQTQWVALGLGDFHLSEVYSCTQCPSCQNDFSSVEHFIIHHSTYSVKGQTEDRTPVAIINKAMTAQEAIMINHPAEWKYLNINLK